MNQVVYAFELRGIQGYLFNTGRLKDMIYASELIDYVFGQPLDEALKAVGADPAKPQPRRAGGAAYLVLDDLQQAQRLRDVWTLIILQLLPGVELVDAIATGNSVKNAVKSALDILQVARNQPLAQLPAATPLTALAPRTGEPAVSNERGESLDASTAVRRHAQRTDSGLTGRFGDENLKWPNNFEDDSHESRRFPLNADNFVGMLHLDGNGIGVLLRILNDAASTLNDADYIVAYQTFSKELERVTCEAAQKATEEVLVPAQTTKGVIPVRPLVLGGDDLTILLRSDLAVPFAMAYAHHFEELSVGFIKQLKQQLNTDNLPLSLTTSGGLVFVKPGFPFSQALALAESFAHLAKIHGTDAQGNKDSALSLYRVQGAVGDDATVLFEREHCIPSSVNNLSIELSLPAYGLTPSSQGKLPSLISLLAAVDCALSPYFSKARLRSLLSLMYQSTALAKAEYYRWRSQMEKDPQARNILHQFDAALEMLVGELASDLPCSKLPNAQGRQKSPISDLLILLETQMASSLTAIKENGHAIA